MNRLQLFLGVNSLQLVATIVMMVLLPVVAPPASGGGYVATAASWVMVSVVMAIPLPFQISMMVRRMHDLGLSAVWLLPLPILIALWAAATHIWPQVDNTWIEAFVVAPFGVAVIALQLVPGQPTDNRYGPAPRAGWLP